jgi:predicted DsbA family dithiol-disulfide isomerase
MTLRIDVWSDIACPWCWVGKRRLDAALRQLGTGAEVHWRAFELDPRAPSRPPEPGVDYVGRLATKYMCSRTQAQAMIDRMTETGAADGLDFRFDRIRPASTFDAHRLMVHAAREGHQDALAERLFRGYFEEGRCLAEHGELAALAAEAGLDPERAAEVLDTEQYAGEVRAEERQAAELGISGVPFFVIDGRYAISGAQPAELMARYLERARDQAAAAAAEGPACGPDACDPVLPTGD